eukprot:4327991-Amphidinium_carterae.1
MNCLLDVKQFMNLLLTPNFDVRRLVLWERIVLRGSAIACIGSHPGELFSPPSSPPMEVLAAVLCALKPVFNGCA